MNIIVKKKKIRFFLLIIFFQIFLIGNSIAKNRIAPNFALMNNKGSFVFKSKLRGNLLIAFWATYCKPCLKEMPHLIDFEKKYNKSKNLKLILINTDHGSSGKSKAENTLRNLGIDHEFLVDPYLLTIEKYNPKKNLPATFLVDKKGLIVFQMIGADPQALKKLEKKIKRLR